MWYTTILKIASRILLIVILNLCSVVAFSQNSKTVEELTKELNTAIQSNDFEKAELLKKELQQAQLRSETLKKLEEDKKIAIFLEKYDEVIVIAKNIEAVKKGETKTAPPTANSNVPFNTPLVAAIASPPAATVQQTKKTLADYDFRQKIIGSYGFGFSTSTEDGYYYNSYTGSYENYATEYSYIGYQLTSNRWWINKYVVGGTWFDFVLSDDYPSIQAGIQTTFLADFGAAFVPYTSFGLGYGLDGLEELYLPLNYKLGSYLFFNKRRGFGVFAELNTYFNNEYTPPFRFGLAWSRVKAKYK